MECSQILLFIDRNTKLVHSLKPSKLIATMTHIIRPVNYRIIQKTQGGISPRLALQVDPEEVERLMERGRRKAEFARALVERERAAAMARGVRIVYDDSRTYAFSIAVLPDEGPNSGT
jgi:hypothetical protein